jgi:uncharacterized membrane protein YfcA
VDHSEPLRDMSFYLKLGVTGLLGGIIAGVTGLGGGIIFIPFLMFLCTLPLKKVSPYSNVAMMISSLMGLLPHLGKVEGLSVGSLDIEIALPLLIGSLITSKLGAKWNSSVSAKTKRVLLLSLLFIVTVKMYYSLSS